MRTLFFLLRKEITQIFRNKLILKMSLAMPIVQLVILPFAVNYEIRNINLSVVDHDKTEYSRKLINKFTSTGYFKLADYSNSYEEALENIENDKADLIMEIPANFESDLIRESKTKIMLSANANTYKTRYVFASIKQNTLAASIRLNWTFTPTLSLQLFMQPFFAVGDYYGFKELAKPRTIDFNLYGQNGSTINYDQDNDEYTVDPDGDGPANKFTFENPDFNYKSLRGTVVLRWEVLPGSIFYFVWSHNQTNLDNPGEFSFNRDFKNLWKSAGDDILMVKFSYWFNM